MNDGYGEKWCRIFLSPFRFVLESLGLPEQNDDIGIEIYWSPQKVKMVVECLLLYRVRRLSKSIEGQIDDVESDCGTEIWGVFCF